MKYLPVLIICFFYHVSFSQVEFVTIQDSAFVTIKAKLDFQRNHAFVESISNPKELIEFPRIRLENGDVIIEYELNNKSRGIFEVQLMTINTLRGKYPEKPELYYGNVGNGISKGSGLNKSFTIINTSKNDNIKWLDGSVTFKIRVINHRTVIIKTRGLGQKLLDCSDVMPTLQFPESFIPELIFGGIGAITYGIGEWIDEESDDLYVQYTDQEEKEAADGIYEDANRKHQDAFVTKGVGLAFFVGSTLYSMHRIIRYKREKKLYNRYCKKRLTFEPFYDWNNSMIGPVGQVGISLMYNF